MDPGFLSEFREIFGAVFSEKGYFGSPCLTKAETGTTIKTNSEVQVASEFSVGYLPESVRFGLCE